MGEKQQFDVWRDQLTPAIISKVDEFHLLGYGQATADEVWDCVVDRLHKKKTFVRMHVFVNELLTLKPQTFMTWLTVQSYKEPVDLLQKGDLP